MTIRSLSFFECLNGPKIYSTICGFAQSYRYNSKQGMCTLLNQELCMNFEHIIVPYVNCGPLFGLEKSQIPHMVFWLREHQLQTQLCQQRSLRLTFTQVWHMCKCDVHMCTCACEINQTRKSKRRCVTFSFSSVCVERVEEQ